MRFGKHMQWINKEISFYFRGLLLSPVCVQPTLWTEFNLQESALADRRESRKEGVGWKKTPCFLYFLYGRGWCCSFISLQICEVKRPVMTECVSQRALTRSNPCPLQDRGCAAVTETCIRAEASAADGVQRPVGSIAANTRVVVFPFCGSFACVLQLCKIRIADWSCWRSRHDGQPSSRSALCGWMQLLKTHSNGNYGHMLRK